MIQVQVKVNFIKNLKVYKNKHLYHKQIFNNNKHNNNNNFFNNNNNNKKSNNRNYNNKILNSKCKQKYKML